MPSKEQINARMRELAEKLDYEFACLDHLANAMYCEKEGERNYSNDALATLGDAVLKLIWSEYFFLEGLDKDEITARKQDMENNDTLHALCERVKLWDYAYNDHYFADQAPRSAQLPRPQHDFYLEAVIAAIYRDRGLAYTRDWVLRFWGKYPDAICQKPLNCKR